MLSLTPPLTWPCLPCAHSLAAACAQELQQSEQSVLLGLGLYLIER